jgi:hypothetical protein
VARFSISINKDKVYIKSRSVIKMLYNAQSLLLLRFKYTTYCRLVPYKYVTHRQNLIIRISNYVVRGPLHETGSPESNHSQHCSNYIARQELYETGSPESDHIQHCSNYICRLTRALRNWERPRKQSLTTLFV